MQDKKEVVKHSAAIEIRNAPSLLQRKAWNWLLCNAYDELPIKDFHSVKVKELAEVMEFKSKNEEYLKQALKGLVSCTVEWNLLNKDKKQVWGVSTLLASAEIENGVCTYSYSVHLRKRLHNPAIYARINLSIENKFESKHSLALYELCSDYRKVGETPWIPIRDYRDLMGVSVDKYTEFKKFNKWVIKDPIKEIDKVSDLTVTSEYKRQGRGGKVVAVKFIVDRKPKEQVITSPPDTYTPLTGLALQLHKRAVKPPSVAIELATNYPEERVRKAINLFDMGIIKTPGGIRRFLEDEWTPSDKQERQVEGLEHSQTEEQRDIRAKEIQAQRVEEAAKTFPKTKEKWAEYRINEAQQIRSLLAHRESLSSDELDEIRRKAFAEYPTTAPDKRAFIKKHANILGGLYDFRLDLEDIKMELAG